MTFRPFDLPTVLLVATLAVAATTPVTRSVPFRLSEGGLILVDVVLNEKVRAEFILDLGAGLHVISPRLLRQLAAVEKGRYTAYRMTGERLDFDLFEIRSVRVGSSKQARPIVGWWSVLDSLQIDGILSAKFFEGRVATLDFRERTLTFHHSGTPLQHVRSAEIVPLRLSPDGATALDLFAAFRFDGLASGECELDTGLDGFIIHSRYMSALGIEAASEAVQKIERKGLTGATERRYRARIGQIALHAAPAVQVRTPTVDFQDIRYDCVVGTAFWADRLVTLDLPHHRMVVTP